jgi:hypothetical protein
MRSKTLAILALGAAIVAGAAVVATGQRDKAASPADMAGQLVFPGLLPRVGELSRIEIEGNGEKFELVRRPDGTWTVPAKAGYPADFPMIRRLALDVADMRIIEARTANPALHAEIDLDGTGKDQKAVRATFYGAQGGPQASLLAGRTRFGRQGTGGDGTFVRKDGENQVWFVRGRIGIERDATKWLARRVVDVQRERVTKAVVVRPDGARLEVTRDAYEKQDFELAPLPDDKKVKSAFDVNLVASGIEALDLEDVRKADGLSFAGERDFVEFATFDGVTLRVEFAREGDAVWARLSARYAAPAAAVTGERLKTADDARKEAETINARAAGWAYKLPNYKVEHMSRALADLVEDKAAGG